MAMIRHSTYHHKFVDLGVTFTERRNFAIANFFSSIEEEHLATRTAVGLYDVCYQAAVDVSGVDAASVLQELVVNDVQKQKIGGVIYTSLCNERGGFIDDVTCFRLGESHYWVFPAPPRVGLVADHISKHAIGRHVSVTDLGYKYAYLSIQGPNSRALLTGLTSADLSTVALPYYSFTSSTVADVPGAIISRTGYSGELGYELFYPSEYAEHMWTAVMDTGKPLGAKPCGFGALCSVRIEKRYPFMGLDIDENTTPVEAGLAWTIKRNKPSFLGRSALIEQLDKGPSQKLVLIELDGIKPLPPTGTAISASGRNIGKVTTADFGYFVKKSLVMGYVEAGGIL